MRCITHFLLYLISPVYSFNQPQFGAAYPQQFQRQNQQTLPAHYPFDYVPGKKTRSLSGTIASDGSNATNAMVLELITVGLLGGYAIRKVKMFNDRIYLARYRRSYWLGDRYYEIDNFYYLPTRDTCVYRMNATERRDMEYEDGVPIYDVIYQCQRYAEYCCGLDCCQYKGRRWADPALDYVNTGNGGHRQPSHSFSVICFLLCSLFTSYYIIR